MPGKSVQRVGDISTGGGVAVGPGHPNVLINGRPALIPLTPFTPHQGCSVKGPQHCFGVVAIAGNATTVRANGLPLVLIGAPDSCFSHKRNGGSTNVLAK